MKLSAQSSKNSDRLTEEQRRVAGFPLTLMMSLGIIVSGVVSGWNQSLYVGIGEYLISLGLCTAGYICLALCIAEMAGIIAFSGGSFGYARCTLSPFIGYLVGMCDLLQSVFYSAVFVDVVAKAFAMASDNQHYLDNLPLWWLTVYGVIILIALPGGKPFWTIMAFFTSLTIVCLLFYCFQNAGRTSFPKFATKEVSPFEGTTHQFFDTLIAPVICYVGVDLITLFGEEVKQPQRTIPWAMLASLLITILFAWWVTLTVVSLHPGVSDEMMDDKIIFPMHFAFEDLYNLSDAVGNLLMAPLVFSSALGFLYASGRQMYSMSKSGLLPAILSKTFGDRHVPIAAMLTSTGLGFLALILRWGMNNHNADDIFELSMVGACFVYLSMFWCFILFRLRYGSMERGFVNPLGLLSAAYGVIYFSAVLMSLLFVQLDFNSLAAFIPYLVVATIYYYKVAESRQFFSREEQEKFMKAYILNANLRKKKKGHQSLLARSLFCFFRETGLYRLVAMIDPDSTFATAHSHSHGSSSPRNGNSSPRASSPRSASSPRNASSPRGRSGSDGDGRSRITTGDIEFVATEVEKKPGLIPGLGLRIDTGTTPDVARSDDCGATTAAVIFPNKVTPSKAVRNGSGSAPSTPRDPPLSTDISQHDVRVNSASPTHKLLTGTPNNRKRVVPMLLLPQEHPLIADDYAEENVVDNILDRIEQGFSPRSSNHPSNKSKNKSSSRSGKSIRKNSPAKDTDNKIVEWSGKIMDENESRKCFGILHGSDSVASILSTATSVANAANNTATAATQNIPVAANDQDDAGSTSVMTLGNELDDLVRELPEQFVVLHAREEHSTATSSTIMSEYHEPSMSLSVTVALPMIGGEEICSVFTTPQVTSPKAPRSPTSLGRHNKTHPMPSALHAAAVLSLKSDDGDQKDVGMIRGVEVV